jgi:hypothetical protein
MSTLFCTVIALNSRNVTIYSQSFLFIISSTVSLKYFILCLFQKLASLHFKRNLIYCIFCSSQITGNSYFPVWIVLILVACILFLSSYPCPINVIPLTITGLLCFYCSDELLLPSFLLILMLYLVFYCFSYC